LYSKIFHLKNKKEISKAGRPITYQIISNKATTIMLFQMGSLNKLKIEIKLFKLTFMNIFVAVNTKKTIFKKNY